MGMASFFVEEDITIKDAEGLKEWLEKARNGTYKEYEGNEFVKQIDAEKPSFDVFNEWKIISYWYDDCLIFLRDIAVFIEGYVKFSFETEDECANVYFEDGKCRIEIGEMKYENYTPEKLYSESIGLRKKPMPEQNENLKKRLLLLKV